MTTNSGKLLATCWMEVTWRLEFVTTIVSVPLFVFTVTDPKLSVPGVAPTPA